MSQTPTSLSPLAGDAARAPAVQDMFDALAPRYDLANRVLSMGLDQRWRRQAIAQLHPERCEHVIDLCAGTLDLSLMLLDAGVKKITAVDFSEKMLEIGRAKIPPGAPIYTIAADAREIPLPDGCADGIIAGFGLRNVPDVDRALAECRRLLRPGGRLVVLDFFEPTGIVSRALHGTYNRFVVPTVGGWITGAGHAYSYLQKSITAFDPHEVFAERMIAQGMEAQSWNVFPPVASMVVGSVKEVGSVKGAG